MEIDSFDTAATLQLMVEASPIGLLVTDVEGTIQVVNAELVRQFGYARDELLQQRVDLLMPEALESIQAARQRQASLMFRMRRPTGAGREVFGRRKDGSSVAVEIGLKPIHTADGRFVLASVVDLTGPRRIQDARRSAIEGQREFERFVAELSFQFINFPAMRSSTRSGTASAESVKS